MRKRARVCVPGFTVRMLLHRFYRAALAIVILNVNDLTINLKNVSYLVFDYSRPLFKLTDEILFSSRSPPLRLLDLEHHFTVYAHPIFLRFFLSNFATLLN